MRRSLIAFVCFAALLVLVGCKQDEVVQAANTVADAPSTGIVVLDMLKGALGLGLAVAGYRTSKAVYSATQYPKTPFTDAELAEIRDGLARIASKPVDPPKA